MGRGDPLECHVCASRYHHSLAIASRAADFPPDKLSGITSASDLLRLTADVAAFCLSFDRHTVNETSKEEK